MSRKKSKVRNSKNFSDNINDFLKVKLPSEQYMYEKEQDLTNYQKSTPYGAQVVTDMLATKQFNDLTNDFLIKSPTPMDGDYIFNKADPYAPNGYFGTLNNPKSTKGEKESKGDRDKSENTNAFTRIPRLMGILGNYVTPPSKVSLADLYNASLDSTIGSIVEVAKSMIISGIGNYYHPNKEIQKFVNESLDILGRTQFHHSATDFLISGFSVGELVWENRNGYSRIVDCVFAPYTNIEFMVDYNGKMTHALQPNLTASNYGIMNTPDIDQPENLFAVREMIPNFIPYVAVENEKLFYCGLNNKFNPYGTSPIRRAYAWYYYKSMAMNMYMIALSKNGSPLLAMFASPDVFRSEKSMVDLKERLSQLSVGDNLIIPCAEGEGVTVKEIKLDCSSLKEFIAFFEYCDKNMVRSFTFPQETMLGQSGSYSSSTVQKETFQDSLQLYIDWYKYPLMERIIKPQIEANFTEEEIMGTYGEFKSILREGDKLERLKQLQVAMAVGLYNPFDEEDVNRESVSLGYGEKTKERMFSSNDKFPLNLEDPNTIVEGKPFSRQGGKPFENIRKETG